MDETGAPPTHDATETAGPGHGTEPQRGSDPLVGSRLAGRFTLVARLGSGGSGTVYEATDELVGRTVALKILRSDQIDDRSRERLRREVRASASGHPNLVQVHEMYEADGRVFLNLELVRGTSLRDLLERDGVLGVETTVAIVRQVAAGLGHLHGQGLVHRDVKPGNILVAGDGAAKLCDLGLVRHLDHGHTVTQTATVVGTPTYMAPEQATGEPLTPATDIYALGLTLYQCLAGTVPHTSDTPLVTLTMRQKARPPRINAERPDCPRWLQRLVAWMLEPRPGERPTAAQVEEALSRRRVRLRVPRRIWLPAAAGVAAMVVLWLGTSALVESATQAVQVGERAVYGLDARGRRTWEVALGAPVSQVERVDLDGDGTEEVVVATQAHPAWTAEPEAQISSEVLVASPKQGVLVHVNVDELVRLWSSPFAKRLNASLSITDLDQDGVAEIVVRCTHMSFYPTELLVYWPRWSLWDHLLHNDGTIYAMDAFVAGNEPRLLYLAYNNPLGLLPVVAEVEIVPPDRRERRTFGATTLSSPPSAGFQSELGRVRSYVLLPQLADGFHSDSARLAVRFDGSVEYWFGALHGVLDQWRNPTPGPNEGAPRLHERLVFLRQLGGLRKELLPPTIASVLSLVETLDNEYAWLLREPAYRATLSLLGARALARAGDPNGAIRLAAAAADETGNEDLVLLLAHLEALTGRLDEAAERLEEVVAHPRTVHGRYDAPHLLLRMAITLGDREIIEGCVQNLAGRHPNPEGRLERTAALRARAHVWWNEVTETDCGVRTWAYEPAGDALACLARWRLGRVETGDPDAMTHLADVQPDAANEANLARAAALHGLGRSREAAALLEPLIKQLEQESRVDFHAWHILQLARELEAEVREANS